MSNSSNIGRIKPRNKARHDAQEIAYRLDMDMNEIPIGPLLAPNNLLQMMHLFSKG